MYRIHANHIWSHYALPITPSCCGDNGSCVTPANEPDANDKRSDRATTEPPGDIERADILDPAKDVISNSKRKNNVEKHAVQSTYLHYVISGCSLKK